MISVGAFGLGACAGLAFGVVHWRRALATEYKQTRALYVERLAEQSGPIDTLVLGDSIAETTLLDGACGRTFNAGVGNARAQVAEEIARIAIPRLHPKSIVVEIGTNYFVYGDNPEFETDYRELISEMPHDAKLVLVGTPRSETANAFIRQTAQRIGARYVAPITGDLTIEGVHPTRRGAEELRRRIEGACMS